MRNKHISINGHTQLNTKPFRYMNCLNDYHFDVDKVNKPCQLIWTS